MLPRIGRVPEIATPIGKGSLLQLINLAQTRQDMKKVIETFTLIHENRVAKTLLEETDAGDAFISEHSFTLYPINAGP